MQQPQESYGCSFLFLYFNISQSKMIIQMTRLLSHNGAKNNSFLSHEEWSKLGSKSCYPAASTRAPAACVPPGDCHGLCMLCSLLLVHGTMIISTAEPWAHGCEAATKTAITSCSVSPPSIYFTCGPILDGSESCNKQQDRVAYCTFKCISCYSTPNAV